MSPAPEYQTPNWLTAYVNRIIKVTGKGLPCGLNGIPWTDPTCQIGWTKKDGAPHWFANPGPQNWALVCPYDEILLGGQRGGGKSALLIALFAMGDITLAPNDPARISFLNDPTFRGLLLREEYQNMAEFVEEAREFFRPFNVKVKDDPAVFEFPHPWLKGSAGAKIYFNHLGSEEAYNKYRGWNITKIGIEELTQIPTLRRYLKLLGSLRSKERRYGKTVLPKLRTQIISTTNPDGPGMSWVKERFVKVYSAGKLIPWNTPMRDPISGLTRIFIPFGRRDNQYLRDDKKYEGMLLSQDDVTRKQWAEGDWEAGSGVFFSEYRPDGPVADEVQKYPWARHRTAPVELKPWWFRWGSADHGYDHPAAFHKFCRNERDKRVHIYDELMLRQVGSYELGVMLANWWLPELEALPDHQVTIYMGEDAFSKTDSSKTIAEQMELGIKEILGPYGALMMRFNDDERAAAQRNQSYAQDLFQRRKAKSEGHMCIVLQPQHVKRIEGWSFFRDMLRFRPARTESEEEIKQRLTSLYNRSGVEAYERELAEYKSHGPEILPKLQIWKKCIELDRCLKVAQHDVDETGRNPKRNEDVRKFNSQDGVGGDDSLESARNGLCAYKEIQTRMPKSYWVAERCSNVQEEHIAAFGEPITDVTRLMQIQTRQAALYAKQNPPAGGTLTLPRASVHRPRVQ